MKIITKVSNLNKDPSSQFIIKITSLITISIILFFFLFYLMVQSSVKRINEDVSYRLSNIESYIDEKFLDVKFKLNNLASSLSKDFIYSNTKFTNELLSYFVQKPGYPISTVYGPAGLYNKNMKMISCSLNSLAQSFQAKVFPEYLKETKKVPFQLQIGKIIYGSFLKELVIPLSISITNISGEYIGLIWTSLLVKDLNDQLTLRYAHNKFLSDIILQNNKNYASDSNYVFHKLDEALSVSSILKALLERNDIIVHRNLKNYPFTIELNIKPEYFESFLGRNILFYIGYLIILILVFFLLYKIVNNYYQTSLLFVHKRLNFVNQVSQNTDNEPDTFTLINEFSLNHFAQDINNLIEHYYLIQKDNLTQAELEKRKKFLDLAFTEKHFLSSKKSSIMNEEKLYLNKLISFIEEEYTTASLTDYLNEVINYCCEFYHEITCKIIVEKKNNKNFSFKHSALNETIFNIFTFIIRGNFEVCIKPIIVKGNFVKGYSFPFITIETTLSDEQSSTLGWMSGTSYVYSGLLSIHLLAKENNMILNIKRKDRKILFILEPLNQYGPSICKYYDL